MQYTLKKDVIEGLFKPTVRAVRRRQVTIMRPYIRLFILIFFVSVLGVMALQFIRRMGSNETTSISNNPLMQRRFWIVARLPAHQCSQAGLQDLLTLDETWLIWLDLQPDTHHELHVVCPASELFALDPSLPSGPALSEVLQELKNRSVIFNLRALDRTFSDSFLKTIRDWAGTKTDIGVASPSQNLIRDLRKREPDWLFASDSSTWSKLKLFSAFGIESTVDLWPDFFVASANSAGANSFTLKSAREIQERQKILLLQLDDDFNFPADWKPFVRGVLTTRPKKFPADTFFREMGAK